MMTLDGTNTWVLREPGARRSVVVDPGPPDESHLDAVAEQAGEVGVVLLTHHHLDHSEAAQRVRRADGLRRTRPRPGVPARVARDSATATSSRSTGSRCASSPRPGTPRTRCRSCCRPSGAVLTGDTVLGRGTTVVAHPDGQLGAYLDSLDRLHALADGARDRHHLARPRPGDRRRPRGARLLHRPPRASGSQQVEAALATPARDRRRRSPPTTLPRRVVEIVYADVDPVLWGAAELSVRAQLAYLAARG